MSGRVRRGAAPATDAVQDPVTAAPNSERETGLDSKGPMATDFVSDIEVLDNAVPATPKRRPGLLYGLVHTARPKQWVKNVLVFAAPGAAGALTEPGVFAQTALAFALFSIAASGTYFVNDARDVHADRLHPKKRHRPIAAGIVPLWLGWTVGILLMVGAVATAFAVGTVGLGAIVAVYVLLTLNYSIWMKHIALLDIAVVAAGFILRALAGGVATGVPISQWFVIVTSFGSLFMVIAKRRAEFSDAGEDAHRTRAALAGYSVELLEHMRTVSSAVTITAYCLWAFEKAGAADSGGIWFELSIAPFLLALFRYAMVCDQGRGGAPEEVILGDRMLQVIGLAWLATFAVGIYVG